MKFALTVSSATFALVAAFLWYKSSVVRVKPEPSDNDEQILVVDDEEGESDFIATTLEQARWSKYAAAAASVSAICQAIALLLPDLK